MPTAAQTRHLLIEMARRRQRPGSGSAIEFLKRRTAELHFPDLSPILRGIPWAATGAAGARLYVPERMTNDLDILVRKDDADIVRQRLQDAGARLAGELSDGGSSLTLRDGFPVDVIEGDEEWVDHALRDSATNLDAQNMPVLPLHYQILMKFRASRVQDLADMSRMLGATDEQLAAVRNLFSTSLPKDMDDLESLITLGRMELQ